MRFVGIIVVDLYHGRRIKLSICNCDNGILRKQAGKLETQKERSLSLEPKNVKIHSLYRGETIVSRLTCTQRSYTAASTIQLSEPSQGECYYFIAVRDVYAGRPCFRSSVMFHSRIQHVPRPCASIHEVPRPI